jgi:hypothetical protein
MPKLPFTLKVKKEDFFFNQKEKRLFFLFIRIGIGLVGLCVLVFIVVSIVRAIPPPRVEEKQETPAFSLNESGGVNKPMSLNAFVIPDESKNELAPQYYLFKTILGKWDQKMVAKYWISPSQIGLENLKKMNDKNIEKMFDDIP